MKKDSTASFWKDFINRHWLKPTLIKRPFAELLVSEEEVFDAIKAASENIRCNSSARLRLYLGRELLNNDKMRTLLPRSSDVYLKDYAQRFTKEGKQQELGLILNNMQCHCDPTVWFRVRKFLDYIYPITGVPGQSVDMDVFLGNYSETPFGVHQDNANVLNIVISGTKRFLFWPSHFFDLEKFDVDLASMSIRSLDINKYREHAIEIVGHPGDIIYWPHDFWHVAVSDGELSVVMTIGLFCGRTDIETDEDGKESELVNTAKSLLTNVEPHREEQIKKLLSWHSASGFRAFPPLKPLKQITENSIIYAPSYGNKVGWFKTECQKIYVASNGYVFDFDYHQVLEAFIKILNQGIHENLAQICSMLEELTGPIDIKLFNYIVELTGGLYRARGIDVLS